MKTSVNEAAKVKRELEEMRQQCAEMSAQLAAAKEKGTGDGLTKAASPGGLASPSTSDISTLTSERDNYKATALRLEMDIKRLSARAAEATQLEKTVAALKEKLQAGEELKTAYAALQSETQALRSQLGAKKSQPVAPKGLEAHGETTDSTAIKKERDALREEVSALREQLAKLREETESLKTGGRSMQAPQATGSEDTSSKEATLTAAEVAELVRERNALQERVRLLEKELEALRQLAKSPAKAPPAPKSAPSPTPTTESPQPPSSKKPPVPTSKGQTIPTSAGLSASADTAVTGKRDKANQPCEALEPRAAEVSPPTAAKALPAATASSTDAPDCSPSEANSATKAALPRKFIPPAGPKVPPVAPPKEVAKTLGGPLPLEGHAKDVPPNNARPVVGKPLPSALLPKATAAPAAAFSSEGTTTPDGQRQPEPHVAAKGTADARVTTAKFGK
ncbi:uncharacterized protein EMH_0067230 [Eimeria mitis]|uniref:Uncharacterized protein n=1 Tax=Eimeria mitis TaxID=44415 RepID=U6KDE2_9EIME|nr:uncharacterized protein EMH_0067230 [Eimeria mitis]CDJ34821.1 hypothetical protein EMH_0067230 [Eimeria mitis]